jgi:hypothetical protein
MTSVVAPAASGRSAAAMVAMMRLTFIRVSPSFVALWYEGTKKNV